MEDFCESHGYKVIKGTLTYRKLAYAFLKATTVAFKEQMARHHGAVIETPKVPPLTSQLHGLELTHFRGRLWT